MRHSDIKIQEIVLDGERISYAIAINKRARHVRMTVGVKDGLVVTIPALWHARFIERFLMEKSKWILKHIKKVNSLEKKTILPQDAEAYKKNKNIFLQTIQKRVEFFNSLYNFRYKKISVRNQTSLWGSCTRAGNLQFNFKLSYLPQGSIDYVVVHELCHLKEHNHGKNFWKLVEKTMPNYLKIRKSLHGYLLQES